MFVLIAPLPSEPSPKIPAVPFPPGIVELKVIVLVELFVVMVVLVPAAKVRAVVVVFAVTVVCPDTGTLENKFWSPVFAPDTVVVPVTANVGVPDPEITTPLTDVGVIAPRESVIAGVVVGLATLPDIPFAVTTDTDVTLPEPPPLVGTFTGGLSTLLWV